MLARRMKSLHTDLSELHLGSLATEHPRSAPRSGERGHQVLKSLPLRLLTGKPQFTRRTLFLSQTGPWSRPSLLTRVERSLAQLSLCILSLPRLSDCGRSGTPYERG